MEDDPFTAGLEQLKREAKEHTKEDGTCEDEEEENVELDKWLNTLLFSDHPLGSLRSDRGLRSEPEPATPCEAVVRCDVNSLRSLCEASEASVNQADHDSRTPLHLAASQGDLEMVTVLVTEVCGCVHGLGLSLVRIDARAPLSRHTGAREALTRSRLAHHTCTHHTRAASRSFVQLRAALRSFAQLRAH